jgi:predicted TPR repeat methyltransferase
LADIKREWDDAAIFRAEQIDTRKDLSFHLVLLPAIDRLRQSCNHHVVLDAGCGTGYLTQHVAASAGSVIGLDVSGVSVAIARERHSAPNITYVEAGIESFAAGSRDGEFTLVTANMVLMTAPDLGGFIQAVARLLAPGGCFVFTITHPWFWPEYWKYSREPWFRYDQEIAVEAPFRISLEQTETTTTHFHRPLDMYANALGNAGFSVLDLDEPTPSKQEQTRYPDDWSFPRFLAVRAAKHDG